MEASAGNTSPPSGNYGGFLVVNDAVISSITGANKATVTDLDDIQGLTLPAGLYVPAGFTDVTISSGCIICGNSE